MTTRHDDVTEDLPAEYEAEGWRVASRRTGADMSQNELNLRHFIGQFTDSPNGHTLLEILLHEHRAEVERLRTALKARRTKVNAATRDAALEEAEGEVDALADDARDSGRQDRAHVLDVASERIRALKSSPCAVLPVDKVREVLRTQRADSRRITSRAAVVQETARRLGVDLDAKADSHDCAPSPDVTCTHGRWWDAPCSECGRGDVVL